MSFDVPNTADSSGPIKTPLLMDFLNTPEKLNRRMIHCPMGRFGEAVEQAKSVVFRESRTGVTLRACQLARTSSQLASTVSHPTLTRSRLGEAPSVHSPVLSYPPATR